jgi:hypothetical protein
MNFKLHSEDNTVFGTQEFLDKISSFFGGTVYARSRKNKKNNKTYHSISRVCFNRISVKKVCDYFSTFPFKGSKHNNFVSWKSVV